MDMLQLMIVDHKAAVNPQDINLQTPLHQGSSRVFLSFIIPASAAGNITAIKFLLSHGANVHLQDK